MRHHYQQGLSRLSGLRHGFKRLIRSEAAPDYIYPKAKTVNRERSSPPPYSPTTRLADFTKALLQAAEQPVDPHYKTQGSELNALLSAGEHSLSQDREYSVHIPAGYDPEKAAPLVMLLHGCRQKHDDIRAISGFDAIADREQFIVVYPFVTRYFGMRNTNCWGWWLKHHIVAGSGEVEDLRRIIAEVQSNLKIDPKRIHIAGLSSGAAMSVAALVAHGTLFNSGASVAGIAYGESARAVRLTRFVAARYRLLSTLVNRMKKQLASKDDLAPLLVIQSHNDKTVEAQAAYNLRDTWLAIKQHPVSEPEPITTQTRHIAWQYKRYGRKNAPSIVETMMLDDVKHAWIGGHKGKYSETDGPNIAEVIWLFFKRNSQ